MNALERQYMLADALGECESAPERELVRAAFELHERGGCEDYAIEMLTWQRAAERVFGHGVIADDGARDRLESVGLCADCLCEIEPGRHEGCAP